VGAEGRRGDYIGSATGEPGWSGYKIYKDDPATNAGHRYRSTVPPEADGLALIELLVQRYAHSSRGRWRERIDAGAVRVDGKTAEAGLLLRRGQVLTWCRPPWVEPEAPDGLPLLYDDGDLIAFDKPAGLPTLPGAGYLERTAYERARRAARDARPVHRLGRWTSGLLLMARTGATRARLGREWADFRKRYRALVTGCPGSDAFEIRQPIGPRPHPRLGSVHAAASDGRAAHSAVRVLERRVGASLCEVEISTGRPHQIRIHLAAVGHPLVGDPLYRAGGEVDGSALPGDGGYLLHAHGLELASSDGRGWLSLRAPLPPALRVLSGGDMSRIAE
jgi:23S rRNA pseudouridine1911/1915/1917 synthase